MYEIKVIDGIPNQDSRLGQKPFVICNHISAGTMQSMTNWFLNPQAQASSHFAISREGEIVQYMRIEARAWTQGITLDLLPNATAQVVKDMNCNPNYYCVSIEHEGYEGDGLDGTLTDKQFYASCWLHRYIMDYCNNTFGVGMDLGAYNVIGHFQIDPKRKPNCPGPNFPWDRLRAELSIAQRMSLKEYELHLSYKSDPLFNMEYCTKVVTRINGLYNKANGSQWSELAAAKLVQIGRFMEESDLMES